VHQVVHDGALDSTNIEGMGLSIVSYLVMDVPVPRRFLMDNAKTRGCRPEVYPCGTLRTEHPRSRQSQAQKAPGPTSSYAFLYQLNKQPVSHYKECYSRNAFAVPFEVFIIGCTVLYRVDHFKTFFNKVL
jgi:hypothetical protein